MKDQFNYESMPLWDITCAARDAVAHRAHPPQHLLDHLEIVEAQLFQLEHLFTNCPAYMGDKS